MKKQSTIQAVKTEIFFDRLFTFNDQIKKLILFCISFFLYANTLTHQYALDDGIVITQNEYVKKGVSGIPDILSKDTFRGFFKKEGKDKLVAGGRYRPLTLVLFAIIYQIAGDNAFLFHLVSILSFAALVVLIYTCIKKLIEPKYPAIADSVAFITGLLFAVHPIHTECVANIKGMDEICALFFSLLAFYFSLIYIQTKKTISLLWIFLSFLFGLFSKENAIVYFALIPIGIFIFSTDKKGLFTILGTLGFACILFLFVRGSILGWNISGTASNELMNNPFLKFVNDKYLPFNSSEKLGTIAHTLGKYIQLLIIPHPLTHDYYPKQIALTEIFSFKSVGSILIYLGLLYLAIKFLFKKSIISYSILLYLFPLFLVSNLLFPVGTLMGERFIFMSSLGFCLVAAFFIIQIKSSTLKQYLVVLILILFSIKTFTRNFAWKNDRTLFSTDIKTSKNSAKIHNALGGVSLEPLVHETDTAIIRNTADKAIKYLSRAIELHPGYFDAYGLRGNAYFYKKDYTNAIAQYQFVLNHQPDDEEAFKNMQIAYRENGRMKGSVYGDIEGAKKDLLKSLEMNPKDIECFMLLGIAEGVSKNFTAAITNFEKALQINPQSAQAYFNLYITYQSSGDQTKAIEMLQKAKQIDPEIEKKNSAQ